MKKNLTQIFLNKIREEYTNNKDDIQLNIVKPILDEIFSNISHYLYFIFISVKIFKLFNLKLKKVHLKNRLTFEKMI